jgi:hypothetical protein
MALELYMVHRADIHDVFTKYVFFIVCCENELAARKMSVCDDGDEHCQWYRIQEDHAYVEASMPAWVVCSSGVPKLSVVRIGTAKAGTPRGVIKRVVGPEWRIFSERK